MAILQLEDQHGQMEAVCFSKEFAAYETLLKSDEPLLLKGTARMEGDGESKNLRLRVTGISSILQTRRQNTRCVRIRVGGADVSDVLVGELKDLFRQYPGGCALGLDVLLDQTTEAQLACGAQWQIDPSDEMIARVERLLGANAVVLS
jgi:DNA polymerase-3 subunit alpha